MSRQFSYSNQIKVSSADLSLAKARTKVCTIRRGVAAVRRELIDLWDGKETLAVRIVSVETRPYGELTVEHALWEGFST
jgi:hypothetical protein